MIEITLISNDGAGLPCRIPVVENTTLEKFLEVSFDGDLDEFTIRVRANGTSVEAHTDYILQDGDRVSLAPQKIDGAMKGPGTNEDQIKTLRAKMNEDDENVAISLVEKFSSNVITLAYKLMRVKVSEEKLPKAVMNLLDNLSEKDATEVRAKLVLAHTRPKAY